MNQKIINLTCLLIIQEAEEILKDYPQNPYQSALINPALWNRLINHVLNRIPNQYYTILNESEEFPDNIRILYSSLKERMHLEMIIRQSIVYLLQEHLGFPYSNIVHKPLP
ncbi:MULTISPECIES: hypothetical protein [unclassified Coleofasciculus]|uniref:hypothetical protein n=1 Tax=unclassified Coleofasciculus TaxID=2692782 RepID=UPI00188222B2|nr:MULTISPECIES: hypothetical protein [unclassified Coleofasciculus]MBE9127544.1 hypothetical protein [Coleofasciculus sp. LEGE 07081]MBE9150871.1 hypothetical protein [Coleofasciculus sp. LEGE 07092]